VQLQDTLNNLKSVVVNLIDKPNEDKYKKLPHKAKSVIKNILPFQYAKKILQKIGFTY
jgi:hypothetical protein